MMTVKQIADKAGVSKTTVTRYLKQIELENGTDYISQNTETKSSRLYLSEELADKLHCLMTATETATSQHQNHNTATENETKGATPQHNNKGNVAVSATKIETPQQPNCNTAISDTIVALNRLIETQQAQIDQQKEIIEHMKDQLAEKDKQIETLSVLLSQQQQLHQTLQVRLLETEAEADEETEKPKKRGLFRIFKKKENNNG